MSNPGEAPNPVPPADGATPPPASATPAAGAGDQPGGGGEADGGQVTPPPADGGTPPPPAAAAPAPAPEPDWRDKRISKLTAQLRALQEAPPPPPPPGDGSSAPAAPTQAEIDSRVAQQVAIIEFNKKCNAVAAEGRGKYTDFDARIGALQQVFDMQDPAEQAAYARLLDAAAETGQGARILYELGADPNQAARFMSLSPVKMGMEMARMASKQEEPEPSRAPKPITPVGGRGAAAEEIKPEDVARADNLSTKTWMERRQAYVDSQRKAGVRIW